MSAFIVKIHNAWLALPEGVRAALSYSVAVLVAAAIALVQNFGWFVPSSVVDIQVQLLAFLTYATPVLAVLAAQLIRSKIGPAIVAWFLGQFNYLDYKPIGPIQNGAQAMLHDGRWYKAMAR